MWTFLNQLIQFYLNNETNLHHLTLHVVYVTLPHNIEMVILLWRHFTLLYVEARQRVLNMFRINFKNLVNFFLVHNPFTPQMSRKFTDELLSYPVNKQKTNKNQA